MAMTYRGSRMCAESCKRVALTTITLTNDGMVRIECTHCHSQSSHATAIDGVVCDAYDEKATRNQRNDNTPITLDKKINRLNVNPFTH